MEKINEEVVREIVKKVLNEMLVSEGFVKERDSSGILRIKTDTVKCEPFSDTPGVYLKDIVSLEEAPRMGAGIMELDHTSFEWTLTYDEYDMVISGVLEIEIDGRIVTGYPLSLIHI